MTALAHEASTTEVPEAMPATELDEALWQAWKTLELPEGFHAEIVEGFIEVSPTGRSCHARTINRLRRALERHLETSDHAVQHDWNVIHGLKAWIPDLFIAPEEDEEFLTEDGLGFAASGVQLIVEVVSPGHENTKRDRVRKRRAYAGAGIPVYVLIDDYDNHGTVTILSSPSPDEEIYAAESRTPYGTEVQIPEGPAKGFAITKAVTGPPRG
jgi:Uma2 family endonuclease